MEELPRSVIQEKEFDEKRCAHCQVNAFQEGYPINLCANCRTTLINYPIPKWIKIFAIAIIAIIVISLIRTQFYISAAINLGKSEKAMEKNEFMTAQKELAKVLKKFPNDLTANTEMLIASAYNLDMASASAAYHKIADKKIEDEALFTQATNAMDYLTENYVKDTITLKKIDLASKNKIELLKLYEQMKHTTSETVLKTYVANYLYDLNDYTTVENILSDILKSKPNFYGALILMAAVKRNVGKYEEALQACDQILKINKENIYAISFKARIELKRKHDQQAAIYAKKAIQLNSEDDSALEAIAMVNYFAGRKKESLKNLSAINAHLALKGDSTISKRLTTLINGSETYR